MQYWPASDEFTDCLRYYSPNRFALWLKLGCKSPRVLRKSWPAQSPLLSHRHNFFFPSFSFAGYSRLRQAQFSTRQNAANWLLSVWARLCSINVEVCLYFYDDVKNITAKLQKFLSSCYRIILQLALDNNCGCVIINKSNDWSFSPCFRYVHISIDDQGNLPTSLMHLYTPPFTKWNIVMNSFRCCLSVSLSV